MGPGFESQRDHQETLEPLENQGVLLFTLLTLTKSDQVKKGSSQKVGD